jgi:hypothetical protein
MSEVSDKLEQSLLKSVEIARSAEIIQAKAFALIAVELKRYNDRKASKDYTAAYMPTP